MKNKILQMLFTATALLTFCSTSAFAAVYEAKNRSEFNTAYNSAVAGDTILFTASFSTDQLSIKKDITLDLNGYTLTTTSGWGGVLLYNGSLINGTLIHTGKTCAIKVFGVVPKIEDMTITLQNPSEDLMLGGIVLQSSNSNTRKIYVGSIKNVVINGEDLSNGIETYLCGNQVDENGDFISVIGGIENVTINSRQYGMWISANVGDIKNSTIHGDLAGIKFEGRGSGWETKANIINTTVDGGSEAAITVVYNGGNFSIVGDKYSTFTSDSNVMFKDAPVASENVTFNMVGVTVNADGSLTFCPHTNVSEGDCDTEAECLDCTKVIGFVHNFVETSRVDSTCTVAGTAYHACDCGATKEVTLPYADHTYVEAVTPPTCDKNGVSTFTCSCGDTYTTTIPALGHTYDGGVKTSATCDKAGFTTFTCSCGHSYEVVDENDPALGHSYEKTGSGDGYVEYTCGTCGDVKQEEVLYVSVAVSAIEIDGDEAKLTIGSEYTEAIVYFGENLGEWDEPTTEEVVDGVITVPATTATGFFKVEAK